MTHLRSYASIFTAAALALALALLVPFVAVAEPPAETMDGMPLVFSDDFESGMDGWAPTDNKSYEVLEEDGNHILGIVRASRYEPAVRSPKFIAWAEDVNVGNFILEVRAKQTGREYGHRDLCFFFGKQADDKFYYVHLATKADDHANSIFLVNEEPRVSIAEERTDGTDWGSEVWHTIRIKRDVASGLIAVYFDDMEKPVMVAHDTHFTSGPIGLGTFDDMGRFDDVRVWGDSKAEDTPAEADSAPAE